MKGNFVYQRLGTSLVKKRRRKGLTQEDLSIRSKVDRTFLGKVERGEANPSFKTMVKLCRALKISMSELVEGV
jgi:transcriptional regulator with XRE-family HTH domain